MNKEVILIVDDDLNIQNILRFNVENAGYSVYTASNGLEAVQCIQQHNVDLVLMDLMMPVMGGFEATCKIRTMSSVPILVLTAAEDTEKKLYGFECGVDDYIVKPFQIKEVLARIRVHLSKIPKGGKYSKGAIIYFNDELELNTDTRECFLRGVNLNLSQTEIDILLLFYNNPKRTFTREQLQQEVWGYGISSGDTRNVDTAICRLRMKIETENTCKKIICTRRGCGYFYPGYSKPVRK